MSRRDYEASRALGKPRYFYHFFRTTENWYYTNNRNPLSFMGSRYEPLEIDHNDIERGSDDNPGAVSITLPEDSALGIVLKEGSAPTPIYVGIALLQSDALDDPAFIFNGELQGADFENEIATIRAVPLQSRLSRPMPRGKWQRFQCIWNTFHPTTCGVAPGPFTHSGTVTAINGLVVTVSGAAAFGGDDPDFFTLGVLTKGEAKGMIEQQSGDDLRLQHFVPGLAVGNTVSILAGDDRTADTCRDKYDNIERFVAFKKIPILNPHYGQGLRN